MWPHGNGFCSQRWGRSALLCRILAFSYYTVFSSFYTCHSLCGSELCLQTHCCPLTIEKVSTQNWVSCSRSAQWFLLLKAQEWGRTFRSLLPSNLLCPSPTSLSFSPHLFLSSLLLSFSSFFLPPSLYSSLYFSPGNTFVSVRSQGRLGSWHTWAQ